jgi:hypothetical protein
VLSLNPQRDIGKAQEKKGDDKMPKIKARRSSARLMLASGC